MLTDDNSLLKEKGTSKRFFSQFSRRVAACAAVSLNGATREGRTPYGLLEGDMLLLAQWTHTVDEPEEMRADSLPQLLQRSTTGVTQIDSASIALKSKSAVSELEAHSCSFRSQ